MTAKTTVISVFASIGCWITCNNVQRGFGMYQEIVDFIKKFNNILDGTPTKNMNPIFNDLQFSELKQLLQRQQITYVGIKPNTGINMGTLAKSAIGLTIIYGCMRLCGYNLRDIFPLTRKSFDNTVNNMCQLINTVSNEIVQVVRKLGILDQNVIEGFTKVGEDINTLGIKVDHVNDGVERVEQHVTVCRTGIQLLCNVVAESLAHNPAPTAIQQSLLKSLNTHVKTTNNIISPQVPAASMRAITCIMNNIQRNTTANGTSIRTRIG